MGSGEAKTSGGKDQSLRLGSPLRLAGLDPDVSTDDHLRGIRPKLENLRVLIVGDIFLDKFTRGNSGGSFAGAPVLNYDSQDSELGGAGNVASCFRALGVKSVTMAAVVGEDDAANDIRKHLQLHGIKDRMVSASTVTTGVYEKILSTEGDATERILEVWRLPEALLVKEPELEGNFTDHVTQIIQSERPHLVIAADQASGVVVTEHVFASVVRACHQAGVTSGNGSWSGCHVWATSHDSDRLINGGFHGADVVMSNEHEFGVGGMEGQDRRLALAKAWELVQTAADVDKVGTQPRPPLLVATLAAKGMLIVSGASSKSDRDSGGPKFHMYPAVKVTEVDATGAGDATITSLGAFLTVGTPLDVAAAGAVRAGALGVTKRGCVRPTLTQITKTFDQLSVSARSPPSKQKRNQQKVAEIPVVMSNREQQSVDKPMQRLSCNPEGSVDVESGIEAIHTARASAGAEGLRVILTSGCFDLLHSGHFQNLNYGASLGDVLVVAIDTDQHVTALKGSGRPIIKLEDRARALATYPGVDCVIHTENVSSVIQDIAPAVFFKGGDYSLRNFPEPERNACASVADPGPCKLMIVPTTPAPLHTSTIHSSLRHSICSIPSLPIFYSLLFHYAASSVILLMLLFFARKRKMLRTNTIIGLMIGMLFLGQVMFAKHASFSF